MGAGLGRTRPKLPAEVDWWDRTRAECITITITGGLPALDSVGGLVEGGGKRALQEGISGSYSYGKKRRAWPPSTAFDESSQAF